MNLARKILWALSPHTVDREAVRKEMMAHDPEYARVSKIQGDALDAITAAGILDGLATREERRFWQRIWKA